MISVILLVIGDTKWQWCDNIGVEKFEKCQGKGYGCMKYLREYINVKC